MYPVSKKFKNKLNESGIINLAKKFDLDYKKLFFKKPNKEENPYKQYKWIVFSHSLDGLTEGKVIHAIPPISKSNKIPWEEWFVLNGKQHHNVLYSINCKKCDEEVTLKKEDQDHPKEVLEKTWYYYNDENLKPKLFQN